MTTLRAATTHVFVAAVLGLAAMQAAANGDEKVKVVKDGIPHDAFFAIDFDGDRGLAGGIHGRVLESTDGGETWTSANIEGVTGALLGVAISGSYQIAVGQAGLIVSRDDDGTWRKRESGTPERLMNVDVNSDGTAFAVGAFGSVLMSRDGGVTWTSAEPDWAEVVDDPSTAAGLGPNLYAIDVRDSGQVTLAGEWGIVLRSDDEGASWRALHHGDTVMQEGDATFFAFYSNGNGLLIAVGQEGAVLRSEDDGETWASVDAGTFANLLSIAAKGEGRVLISGMRDMVISGDKGATWRQVSGADIAIGWYSGIAAPRNGDRFFAVGHSGRMLSIGGNGGESPAVASN